MKSSSTSNIYKQFQSYREINGITVVALHLMGTDKKMDAFLYTGLNLNSDLKLCTIASP